MNVEISKILYLENGKDANAKNLFVMLHRNFKETDSLNQLIDNFKI